MCKTRIIWLSPKYHYFVEQLLGWIGPSTTLRLKMVIFLTSVLNFSGFPYNILKRKWFQLLIHSFPKEKIENNLSKVKHAHWVWQGCYLHLTSASFCSLGIDVANMLEVVTFSELILELMDLFHLRSLLISICLFLLL